MTKTLTRKDLEKLIRECIQEIAMCRNKDTGHFDDCSPGNVYSVTRAGAQRAGIDSKYVGRGTMTKNRKIDSPFGANTSDTKQCGRMKISGEPKKKDRRCRDYKQKGRYHIKELGSLSLFDSEGIRRFDMMADDYNGQEPDVFISLNDLIDALDLIDDNQSQPQLVESRQALIAKCQRIGMKTQTEFFRNLVSSLDTLKRASDGKLQGD